MAAGDQWLLAAGKNIRDRASVHDTEFYREKPRAGKSFSQVTDDNLQAFIEGKDISGSGLVEGEYMDMLSKAITWMPANIFMVPNKKREDAGSELDTTAEPVVGKENYTIYKDAYDNMEAVIKNGEKSKDDMLLDNMETKALVNLKKIAEMRSEPWPFNKEQWELVDGEWKVKRNDSLDGAPAKGAEAPSQEAEVHAQESADHAGADSHVQEAEVHAQEGADHAGADPHVQEDEVHVQEDASDAGADTGHMEEDT